MLVQAVTSIFVDTAGHETMMAEDVRPGVAVYALWTIGTLMVVSRHSGDC
jgi:hypothetical protein